MVKNADRPKCQIALPSPSPPPVEENLWTHISLLNPETYPHAVAVTENAKNSISDIIEDLVFNGADDDGYGLDPLASLQDPDEADSDCDDLPSLWSDERYLAELGFAQPSDNDDEDDVNLTNVMQQFGT